MTALAHSLSLDARQRGMLAAMGIAGLEHWLQAEAAVTAVAAPEAENSQKTAPKTDFQGINQPISPVEHARAATELVAKKISSPPAKPIPPPPPALPQRPAGIDSMGWSALQQAVKNCQACGLCQSRKNTVFGTGAASESSDIAPRVDWLIVGEAPGEQEDLQGQPFVGQAGKLLDNMLAATRVGADKKALSRTESVYITNVLKCRPPGNRNPAPEEVAMCSAYLERQIELLQPKIILALGRFAIQALTGSSEPVGKLRGRLHALQMPGLKTSQQTPVVVSYHPAYLLRNLVDKAKAWQDLTLALRSHAEIVSRENLETIASPLVS